MLVNESKRRTARVARGARKCKTPGAGTGRFKTLRSDDQAD